MRIRALRGVCVGVDRHLVPGDVRDDLEPALIQYLTSIGAVEGVPEPAVEPAVEAPVVDQDEPQTRKTKEK